MTTPPLSPLPVQSLFLQHAATVRGFVLGLVADRAAADDIFQEVFLAVARQEADFDRNGSFVAWVRGIARNKVFEHYRRQKTKARLFDQQLLELVADAADLPDDGLDTRREALARCLRQLAPRAREIIDLRYAEQPLAPPELAARIGWTTNAVNVALARARAFLRLCTRRMLASGEIS